MSYLQPLEKFDGDLHVTSAEAFARHSDDIMKHKYQRPLTSFCVAVSIAKTTKPKAPSLR